MRDKHEAVHECRDSNLYVDNMQGDNHEVGMNRGTQVLRGVETPGGLKS